MSLKDLISEIEKIGEKKLKELEAKLEEGLKAVEADYKEKREAAVAAINKKAEEAADRVKTRAEMLANTERRKQILAKKRELIETVFDEALKALVTSNDYSKYIKEALEKAEKEVKEGEIIPAKGKKEETEAAAKETPFTVVAEGSFKGGFVLKTGKVEYDYTFDSIIEKNLRDELETKVANILF